MIALLSACGPLADDPEPPDTGTHSTGTGTPQTTETWASVVATDIPGGTLLSDWSNGDEVWMVGGDFDASTGHLVRWRGQDVCTELDVADGALAIGRARQMTKDGWAERKV